MCKTLLFLRQIVSVLEDQYEHRVIYTYTHLLICLNIWIWKLVQLFFHYSNLVCNMTSFNILEVLVAQFTFCNSEYYVQNIPDWN